MVVVVWCLLHFWGPTGTGLTTDWGKVVSAFTVKGMALPVTFSESDYWELNNSDTSTTGNNSNVTDDPNNEFFPAIGIPNSVILVIVLGGLICVTMVGNVLVCVAVILVRKLRRPQNYLLVSLATSDLCVAMTVMPFAIVNELHQNEWPLSSALCSIWVSGEQVSETNLIFDNEGWLGQNVSVEYF